MAHHVWSATVALDESQQKHTLSSSSIRAAIENISIWKSQLTADHFHYC